jgi:hypothetical protein
MKNKLLIAGVIFLASCFSSCKPKNVSADNIELYVMNNSLTNEKIDVEISINDKLFFKKRQIESFYNSEARLSPGNYLVRVTVKNRNLRNIAKIRVEEGESYQIVLHYTYQPPFDSAKFVIVSHAIKNRIISRKDSSSFLTDVENNKASYKESPREIKFEFINRKSIRIK